MIPMKMLEDSTYSADSRYDLSTPLELEKPEEVGALELYQPPDEKPKKIISILPSAPLTVESCRPSSNRTRITQER